MEVKEDRDLLAQIAEKERFLMVTAVVVEQSTVNYFGRGLLSPPSPSATPSLKLSMLFKLLITESFYVHHGTS